MKGTVRLLLAAVFAFGLVQAAEAGFSVGGKLWYVQFAQDNLDNAVMIGPKAELTSGDFWLSGMILVGKTKIGDGIDMDLQDAEIVAGMSFSVFDLGAGLRQTTWTLKNSYGSDDLKIFGPMVYAGAGSQFEKSPIGWYAGASLMFLDLGDTKDALGDSGEHFNIEGGVSYTVNKLQFTLGYRIKKFIKYSSGSDDMTQSGPAVSGVFTF